MTRTWGAYLRIISLGFMTLMAKASPMACANEELQPIRTLESILLKKKPIREVHTLRMAHCAFEKKAFTKGYRLLAQFPHHSEYLDYRYWLLAKANYDQATYLLKKKQLRTSQQLAKKAIQWNLKIQERYPYSPLVLHFSEEVGMAEILLGELAWQTSHWKAARENFENAFYRLSKQNHLHLLQITEITHYANACQRTTPSECSYWMSQLLRVFGKNSKEGKIIAESWNDHKTPPLRSLWSEHIPFKRMTQHYKSPDQDQEAFDQALKFYLEEKYDLAIENFSKFIQQFPKSAHQTRVKFWLAQALARKKLQSQAEKHYDELHQQMPLSYYGLLSTQALGKPLETKLPHKEDLLATFQEKQLTHLEQFHLRRAEAFIVADAKDWAANELQHIKTREQFSSPFLVYLACLHSQVGNYVHTFKIMNELSQRGYPGILSPNALKMIFPTSLFSLISQYTEPQGLDPILVLSLIKQESGFDSSVRSPAGAIGLMQLIPTTAFDTDAQTKAHTLAQTEDNIRIGTKYLKKLLDRFQGNIILALIGYNAGPNVVDRWLKNTSFNLSNFRALASPNPTSSGVLEFIELIPYRETREYVSSIIRNYYWYGIQLQQQTTKKIDYFWSPYLPRSYQKM